MIKAQHTPGPWVIAEAVENKRETSIRRIRNADLQSLDHGAICEVYGIRDNTIAAANARLIASAPELLAALEEVIKVFDSNPSSISDTVWVTGGSPETLYDHCLSAIAKAKGE